MESSAPGRGTKNYYYWPGMLKDVTRYINSCGSCRKNKSRNKSETGLTSGMAYPEQRWDVIHVEKKKKKKKTLRWSLAQIFPGPDFDFWKKRVLLIFFYFFHLKFWPGN